MSLCKWSCFCLLGGLFFIGWPLQGNCEILRVGNPPTKAKECRVHIEKALEQYWDQKDSPEQPNTQQATQDLNERNYAEDDSRTNPHQNSEENRNKINYENDEDEDEEENSENTSTEEVEDADEDDEEETDDNDEDVDDDEEEEEEEESEDQNEEVEEDNEEEDEDEDDENDDESSNVDAQTTDSEDFKNEPTENDVQHTDSENEKNYSTESTEQSDSNIDHSAESSNEDNAETNEDGNNDEDDEVENENDDSEEEEDEEEEEVEENESNGSPTSEDVTNQNTQSYETETSKDQVEADAQKTTESIREPEAPTEQPNVSVSVDSSQPESKNDVSGSESPVREDDDSIENIYEEDEASEAEDSSTFRSREHIHVILGLDDVDKETEKDEEKLAQSVFRDIKKIETTHIKPMEHLYKYADSTTRVLGDAEIFNKPMLLFLGPWSTGKTSVINYILGLERTPTALKTGTGITDVDFRLLTYGTQQRVISGTELAADWRYAGVQKFGQGLLDHFRSIHIPHALLQKVTIIDSPGIVESKKNTDRGYSLSDAFQWFIDRADAIYVVLDPSKVDIGNELGSVVEQLQGRDVRFLLNKADTIRRSDLMRVVGQLFWNLSPLMSGTEAPLIYAVSLTSHPYHPSAPANFLTDQEKNFFYDMKDTLDKRVENRILYARKHAVRVRNHAKMVDCYLASYYRHKSIFSSKRNVAKLITENPLEYSIYDGLSSMSNVSRHDLPNPLRYKEFFKLHPNNLSQQMKLQP